MATSKPLQAGDLDRKIDILALGTHKNTKGGIDGSSYGFFLQGVFAKKDEKGGTESPEAGRETAFGQVEFTIRYRSDLKETMRVVCESIEYDIENIREVNRRQWLVLSCKKHN